MKKATALVIALLSGATLLAANHTNDSIVTWRKIVGVISAPGVDNPVAVVTEDQGAHSAPDAGAAIVVLARRHQSFTA